MLFFMRSRGIPKEEAERMLVQAFLADAIELIGDESIVNALEARTRRWLGMRAETD
jgi:Fe-S cluster assembly protein SufD